MDAWLDSKVGEVNPDKRPLLERLARPAYCLRTQIPRGSGFRRSRTSRRRARPPAWWPTTCSTGSTRAERRLQRGHQLDRCVTGRGPAARIDRRAVGAGLDLGHPPQDLAAPVIVIVSAQDLRLTAAGCASGRRKGGVA